MTEQDIFDAFVRRWVHSSDVVNEAGLRETEASLSLALPGAYCRFVAQHGTPHCPALLGAIVEAGHELHDLKEFLAIDDIASATAAYESGGMQQGFVGFAVDCMANMFLFDKTDCLPRNDDAAVWFFDHDLVSVEREAPSFAKWLERYATLAPR
jgi:hypothetical protein